MLSNKQHVNKLFLLIDNNKDKKYLQKLSNFNKFSFIYNSLINIKLISRHKFKDFFLDQIIIVYF